MKGDVTTATLVCVTLAAAIASFYFVGRSRQNDCLLTREVSRGCPWQALLDPALDAVCRASKFNGPPSMNPDAPSVFTWHADPGFLMLAYSAEDYITSVSKPNTQFFEHGTSKFFVDTLSLVRDSRGTGGQQACDANPVWFLDVGRNRDYRAEYPACSESVALVCRSAVTSAFTLCTLLLLGFPLSPLKASSRRLRV